MDILKNYINGRKSENGLSTKTIGAIAGTLLLTSNAIATNNNAYCNIPNSHANSACNLGHESVLNQNPSLMPKLRDVDGESFYNLGNEFGEISVTVLQGFLDENSGLMLTPNGLSIRLIEEDSENEYSGTYQQGGGTKSIKAEFRKYLENL